MSKTVQRVLKDVFDFLVCIRTIMNKQMRRWK